jgi:cytoskeletal protein RodZ
MHDHGSILALATLRRNRGITLQEISQSTKIGVRSLEAIEREEFGKLPGGIYATSYIRQYARAIDYPEDDLLECYRRHLAGKNTASQSTSDKNLYGGFRPASTPAGS